MRHNNNFDNLSCGEFLHPTICHVDKFLHMTDFFLRGYDPWYPGQISRVQISRVRPVTNIRSARTKIKPSNLFAKFSSNLDCAISNFFPEKVSKGRFFLLAKEKVWKAWIVSEIRICSTRLMGKFSENQKWQFHEYYEVNTLSWLSESTCGVQGKVFFGNFLFSEFSLNLLDS